MSKKSWFGNLMGNERDETHMILIKERPLSAIKADLIHAFLSVSAGVAVLLNSLISMHLRSLT